MNGSPSFQLNWNLFGNNNGSPLFQQFDWSNLSLPSLTSNGSPLNNNQPYYPFGGNYYINPIFRRTTNGSPASASGVDDGTSSISAGTAGLDKTDTIFDTDNNNNSNTFGQAFGNIFSSGLSSAGNKILNNVVKGESFLKGLSTDSLSTVAGSATGLASNLVGQGISGIMGNSRLGRGIGQGVATGLGTVGGTVVSNLLKGQSIAGNASKLFGTGNSIFTTTKSVKDASGNVLKSTAGAINPYALGMSMAGTALSAITGPSKEYAGRYGNITQTMDTVYDAASAAANFIPGVGQTVSGLMTLNKGLSNIFGSTDGMCVCAGTKVFTSSGDIINIEDLIQEKGIIGWDENSHSILPNNIAGIIEPRQKECLEIELKNGTILRCSIDHPILSNIKEKAESHRINGKRVAYREWSFRRADELKVGNFVGLANNIDYWGTEKLPNAYLVGMLIGDGTYTYESSCRLCSVDPSTWKYIEDNNLGVINNCSGNDPNKYSTEYRTYRIINGMELMKDLGIAYQSGTNKTLPKNLGKYDKDSICKMIAGLYDTDGSISVNEEKEQWKITFYQSNLDLLEHLKLLLQKLGIFSTIYTRKTSINKLANGKIINSNKSYRLEITDMYSANNFYNNIPLNIDYKKEHLERIHQMLLNKKPQEHNELSGAKQYKIISIKSIGIQTVYNLEASETHTYLANGIITHNTKTDAILGSAFMPAPVKWLNMLGSSKTGTFNNQSWQNSEQANSFMQNGFGNLNERFQRAMEEAGKRYGTFSHGAKNRAQRNIDFANTAWEQVLQMAAQNRLQNIRSQDMTSINNQKYTQWIQGGWSPSLVGRGKQGMKIFNNATNHNIGQRLLSSAALIDNRQMILSAQNGIKFKTTKGII